MQLDAPKDSMNFFKAKEILPKESSNTAHFFNMISNLVSSFKFINFIGFVVSMLLTLGVINYIQGSEARNKLNAQEIAFAQQQIINKEKAIIDAANAVALQAKKDEEIAKKVAQKKIDIVANMNAEHFNKILDHLEAVRLKETGKLMELYWSIVYINKNDTALDMAHTNNLLRATFQSVNKFYYFRKTEMEATFTSIKNKQLEMIQNTYDGANPVDKILIWDTITRTNSFPFNDETNTLLSSSGQHLKTPDGLVKYLKENKQLIEDSRGMFE